MHRAGAQGRIGERRGFIPEAQWNHAPGKASGRSKGMFRPEGHMSKMDNNISPPVICFGGWHAPSTGKAHDPTLQPPGAG
jgi:hypothetical protein